METTSYDIKTIPLHQHVLVIGGGAQGLAVVRTLHRLGYETAVVEQTGPNALRELSGQIGNFSARIQTPDGEHTVLCGAVVIAAEAPTPAGKREWQHRFWLTEIDLALADLVKRKGVRTIGLILDIERDETKASMEIALKLAQRIQQLKRYQTLLFCREVRVTAKPLERLYDDVRNLGVNIIKYDGAIMLTETAKGVHVAYTDAILRQQFTIYCDRVGVSPLGVSTPVDTRLAELLGLATDAYGQLQPNNVHLFPGQTNRPGILVVGAYRGEHYQPQIMAEANAVALEVHALLSQKTLAIELSNAAVDPDKCALCLTCIRSCPFKAMQIDPVKNAAACLPEVCQKCGICAGECPAKAIELPRYADKEILNDANLWK
jgi:heterodisulfide reductase subunit A-like polyferredoxin